ncbi:MAG: 6-bladed beta-propeller [Acidobacteriota bacterium]|nr:6-bladed beta-propeller [Acidobacteriota bacterium]
MNIVFLVSILGLASSPELFIDRTEIFVTVGIYQAALSPKYGFYFADKQEKKILHFDTRGRRMPDIGRAGQGPGEFEWISSIALVEDRLYVMSQVGRQVHVLTPDGTFVKRYRRVPSGCFDPIRPACKVPNGWVFVDRENALVHSSDDFTDIRIIAGALPDPAEKWKLSDRDKHLVKEYDPVFAFFWFDQAADGNIYFVEPWTGFKINVYDPRSRKIIRTIEKSFEPVPVPRGWAESQFEKHKQKPNRLYRNVTWELSYPSHFPAVSWMYIDWQNRLVITQRKRDLAGKSTAIRHDLAGNPIGIAPKSYAWVIGVMDGWAYVKAKNDDELQVVRLPPDQLDAYLNSLP